MNYARLQCARPLSAVIITPPRYYNNDNVFDVVIKTHRVFIIVFYNNIILYKTFSINDFVDFCTVFVLDNDIRHFRLCRHHHHHHHHHHRYHCYVPPSTIHIIVMIWLKKSFWYNIIILFTVLYYQSTNGRDMKRNDGWTLTKNDVCWNCYIANPFLHFFGFANNG